MLCSFLISFSFHLSTHTASLFDSLSVPACLLCDCTGLTPDALLWLYYLTSAWWTLTSLCTFALFRLLYPTGSILHPPARPHLGLLLAKAAQIGLSKSCVGPVLALSRLSELSQLWHCLILRFISLITPQEPLLVCLSVSAICVFAHRCKFQSVSYTTNLLVQICDPGYILPSSY